MDKGGNMKIVLDCGSTHMGNKDYCFELIDKAKEFGADAIKFQLGVKEPNIDLPLEWFPELVIRAQSNEIEITASCFSDKAYDMLREFRPCFMKFGYRQAPERLMYIQDCLGDCLDVVVSCDVMNQHLFPDECIKLWCEGLYPSMHQISWDELFPLFDGVSDHSLGFRQTFDAVSSGARWVEKHFKLNYSDINCPDSRFALGETQTKDMIKSLDWLYNRPRGCE